MIEVFWISMRKRIRIYIVDLSTHDVTIVYGVKVPVGNTEGWVDVGTRAKVRWIYVLQCTRIYVKLGNKGN
jgi:hypothetical protein